MATNFRNFITKQGVTAEGGDITIKNGNKLKLNDSNENSISLVAPTLSADYELTLPTTDGDANQLLQTDGSGALSWVSIGDLGGGTVTSVDLSVPTGLAISGNPITTSGTLALTLDTGYEIPQTATLNSYVTLTGVQTITNKTLTTPVLTSPEITGDTTFANDSSNVDFDIASHDGSNGLKLGGTLVTASAAELNFNDGAAAGTVNNGKTVVYGSTGELAVGDGKLTINGTAVTSTAAELNVLDGVSATLTASELDILDGALVSTSELNILNGVNAATNDLNLLAGLVATDSATQANFQLLVDFAQTGVTATEFGYLDTVSSNIQTQLNGKLADTVARVTDVTFNSATGVLTIDDKDGTGTDIDLNNYAGIGTTSLSLSANTLTYTDANGDQTNIDLSLYLDDSNLARLTSGSVDANGTATFTRDDGTNFTVDFGNLFDGYNLSVGADDSTMRSLGSGESIKFIGAQNVTTASDAEGNITITGPDLSSYVTLTGTQTLTNKTLTSAEAATQFKLPDDVELRFGTGDDVKVDFDGTDWVLNVSAGDTLLQTAADIKFQNNAGTTDLFVVDQDGETSIRYNGVEKLNTTTNGIDVTGRLEIGSISRQTTSSANSATSGTITFTGFGAEILIMVEDVLDEDKHQILKCLVTHDGAGNSFINQYGATWNDSELISGISASESSGTVTVTVSTTASSKIRMHCLAMG